jgi:hypothetical protein
LRLVDRNAKKYYPETKSQKTTIAVYNNKRMRSEIKMGFELVPGLIGDLFQKPLLALQSGRGRAFKFPQRNQLPLALNFSNARTHAMLTRHGYTARRCGEAGPALGVGERRMLSHPGFAENGLPPGTPAWRECFAGLSSGRACVAHMAPSRSQEGCRGDRSCGQKPLNGALDGAIFRFFR